MNDLTAVSVVLPSLDPDEKLLLTIDGLLKEGFTDIILVNDGSRPENLHFFEQAARSNCVTLLHHPVNRGKGAALKTAFSYFLEHRQHGLGVVTVDGDGQHHRSDTRACAENMLRSGRLTLGVRDFDHPDVPLRSRSGNKITSFVFKAFVGMTISDTQTGLRAIPRQHLADLIAISGDRFEYETNMLLAMKSQSIAFDEVKIRTVYIEENKSSHFRAVRDSWRIYKLILAHFFRFTGSSLLSAFVDEGMYLLLTVVLHDVLAGGLAVVSALGARAVSSLLNFFLNKGFVFHNHSNLKKALGKYYLLAVPLAIAQALLTDWINLLFNLAPGQLLLRSAAHIAVMILLYFVSFTVQQRWVFAPGNNHRNEE